MFQSCGQKNNFRESERRKRAYFLWVWVLIEEFLFWMEEVMCLWMEGVLCHGIEEGVLEEKSLSGLMGLRKERCGEKFIRFSKSFILILSFFFNLCFFFNIMLTWKIVGVSKVSVIYIYIYIYI